MRIGFLQRPMETGGPGSFQVRFERELKRLGHEVVFLSEHTSKTPDVILAIGAPLKSLLLLIRWKKRGIPIVHRLAGPYWRHRVEPMPMRRRLEHMLRNRIMRFVRDRLADYVVYQSRFVQHWWHAECGLAPCPETMIVNGVDLQEFTPSSSMDNSERKLTIIVAETTIEGNVPTIEVLTTLPRLIANSGIIKGVEIYGKIPLKVRERLEGIPGLKLMGSVPREHMPSIFRRRGIYLSLKIIHSCPNVVLEALASGMPVVGFDSGALPELVSSEAGCIVPYGANPWLLEPPDVESLYRAIEKIAQHLDNYRVAARALAERRFSIETMAAAYIAVFQDVITR